MAAFQNFLRMLGLSGSEQAVATPYASTPPVEPRALDHGTEPAAPPPATDSNAASEPEIVVGAAPPQATLAMPQLVATTGFYPDRDGGGAQPFFTQGMIEPFAGAPGVFGAPQAQGQMLPINTPTNQALFSLYGTSFGGNGINNFALPNLKGRAVVGGSQVGEEGQQTLALTYLIAAGGSEVPLPGMIAAFGGNFAPDGWLAADGSLQPISAHVTLFEVIGATYGGNGATDFALPDLNGAAAVGAGQGPGLPPVALGQKVSGTVPGLGLNYLICTTGLYPETGGNGGFPPNEAWLGQIVAYAGAQPPSGWALCDGALVQIANNDVLFNLIGTTYGGDGENTFALPDLRGRMMTGQ